MIHRIIPLLMIVVLVFWSCEDESDEQEDSFSLSTSMTLDTLFEGSTVYMSGWYLDTTMTQMVACYWVDGARIDLEYGAAEDIKVVGGDIYLAGQWFDETGWNGSACYWKNGERFDLEGGSQSGTEASAIFVDNGDVFVSGTRIADVGFFGTPIACYWKNGDRTDLTTSDMDAMGLGIGINNGDVYVTGWRIQSHTTIACYWKNGAINNLHGTAYFGEAYDIAFKGDNFYIGGWRGPENGDRWNACYWRNGNLNNINRNSSYGTCIGSEANAIFIDGDDIYLAGFNKVVNLNDIATKWKNGNTHELSGDSANVQVSWLLDIAVKDNIKISVGYYHPGVEYEYDYTPYLPCFPIYYVNGKRYNLEDNEWQDGMATGVVID